MGCVNSKTQKIFYPKPIKLKEKNKKTNVNNKKDEIEKFVKEIIMNAKENILSDNYIFYDLESYM